MEKFVFVISITLKITIPMTIIRRRKKNDYNNYNKYNSICLL